MKNILLIINPNAGTKKANKYLTDILVLFKENGYDTRVCVTMGKNQVMPYVKHYGDESDMIVCIGGDGTFNETVEAVISTGCDKPIGYIPAGSTNDFANGLNLSKRIMDAARDIMTGTPVAIDIGKFNNRYFSYIASCGLFTKVSYNTPQSVKNTYGHLAYVIEGLKDLANIKSVHLRTEADGKVFEDDYIFAAICNSTSVGGILTIKPDVVDLTDGMMEILLIKTPKNIIDLNNIVVALNAQDYSTDLITFCSANNAVIYTDASDNWTLDGEFMAGCEKISMECLNKAVKFIVPKRNGIIEI